MSSYIDADAFEPMLLEEYERATWIEHNTIKMVFELLSAMPTADVVEVVHGEWISDEDGNISCSVCGRSGVGESFCEHCGAKMDGVV